MNLLEAFTVVNSVNVCCFLSIFTDDDDDGEGGGKHNLKQRGKEKGSSINFHSFIFELMVILSQFSHN